METTANLRLPLLQPGQAQKELFHNESLLILDIVSAAVVEEPPVNEPPATPSTGSCYIVGDQPAGGWAGKADQLAAYTAGGWRYVSPTEGLYVHVRSNGTRARFMNGSWNFAESVAEPVGGTQVDLEARAAISEILAVLRGNGLVGA